MAESNGKDEKNITPYILLEIMHFCLITRVHTTTHLSRHHATAPRTSWRFGGSSSCLDESSHPWVPAGHPQYMGASLTDTESPNHHNGHQHIWHAEYEKTTKEKGLVPGGFDQNNGRQTVHFTLVSPWTNTRTRGTRLL